MPRDDTRIRPFADLLTELDRGRVHDEASVGLHDLIQQVQATGKAGTVTVALAVKPDGDEQFKVECTVTVKAPKTKPTQQTYFLGPDGNLTRQFPGQERLPLREVPKDPGESPADRASGKASR